MTGLTYAEILKSHNLIFPVLYYATFDNLERGKIIQVKVGPRNPEYIVFNPLDFDEINQEVSSSRRLINLREYHSNKKDAGAGEVICA